MILVLSRECYIWTLIDCYTDYCFCCRTVFIIRELVKCHELHAGRVDPQVGLTRRSGWPQVGLTRRSGWPAGRVDQQVGLTRRSGWPAGRVDRRSGWLAGRVDPQVGLTRRSGRVGSENLQVLAGRVHAVLVNIKNCSLLFTLYTILNKFHVV